MKIAAGSSNPQLAKDIAEHLSLPLLDITLDFFANREKRVHVREEVHGENIAVVQSFSDPTDNHIIEYLLIADALERMGARHVSLILPWMGYSLQDKVFRPGEPIAAKVVANLVSNTYTKRVYLLDLHNTSTPGFFSIPSHHLSALELFEKHAREQIGIADGVVVSPDFGGLKRARTFANHLELDLANIDKHRNLKTGEVTAVDIHGDVSGKDAIILDDVIVSGGTAIETSTLLKANGAKSVHFMATHGIFTDDSLSKLQESDLDSIVITDSIHHDNLSSKIKVLGSAAIFADAMNHWIKK